MPATRRTPRSAGTGRAAGGAGVGMRWLADTEDPPGEIPHLRRTKMTLSTLDYAFNARDYAF